MTKAQQRQAADMLKRVVKRIDRGDVEAPAWYRERLVGVDHCAPAREGPTKPPGEVRCGRPFYHRVGQSGCDD
jgi:hypothetical protein